MVSSARGFSSADLAGLIDAEFGPGRCALRLIQASREHEGYDRAAACTLVAAAKGQAGEHWNERRLAVLLLENQLLRLAASELTEFDLVFEGLSLPAADLVRRMGRLRRLHRAIQAVDCGRVPWEYFLRAARDEPKLTLARYTFTAEEVVRRIESEVLISKGVEDTISRLGNQAAPRWCEEPIDAPAYEKEILRRLCAGHRIFWVSERCGSELNAMVEYPLTSAVVVIKPPGSDLEFEIKRAGTRGARLLNVITRRNGKEAPVSHRLFGGSLGWLAQRETSSAGVFSKIYQLVHGCEGPCSRTVMNSSVVTVPVNGREIHILDYLSDGRRFGPGFEETKAAMQDCVESFPRDTAIPAASYRGSAGLALQFVGQALPQQAVIFGSSSFRLDRIALYLSAAGPEHYFRAGLERGYTLRDVRWLADSVLEEILGEVEIPPAPYSDYAQYVGDVFRVPENRARADANYLSLMQQIGESWGTLLAVRGFSDGESFVLRNAGLKSVWNDGTWGIRIIFMDHDDLTVAGSRYQYLWPRREVAGAQRDQVHILGGPMSDEIIPGEVDALGNIYRVSPETADAGVRALEEALRNAYRKTQSQIDTNRELQDLFYPAFIERHRDQDELVSRFLEAGLSRTAEWTTGAKDYMKARHYDAELIAETTETICRYRAFFERLSFLYTK